MNPFIWFRKEVLGHSSVTKYGGLEMGCCCYNHLDCKDCDDEKCHNGFDRKMKELETKRD